MNEDLRFKNAANIQSLRYIQEIAHKRFYDLDMFTGYLLDDGYEFRLDWDAEELETNYLMYIYLHTAYERGWNCCEATEAWTIELNGKEMQVDALIEELLVNS